MKLPVDACVEIMKFIVSEHQKVTKGKVNIEPGDELRMILECGGEFNFEVILTKTDPEEDCDTDGGDE